MYNCPHCQQPTITAWRKANASDALFWGTIILAFWLKSWLALLIFPLALWLVALVVGLVFNLKPIDIETLKQQRAKRNRTFWWLVAVILLLCVVGLLKELS